MFYAHGELERGGRATLPADYPERALYVAAGSVEIDDRVHGVGRMLVFAPGEPVAITGVEKAIVLLLGGEPLGERFVEWNFVSSSRERIEQAKADWRAGRLKLPVLDDREWIPLPGDPPPPGGPS
jgi:redox-sensitive bicupin YhaK (pirin superfamily)